MFSYLSSLIYNDELISAITNHDMEKTIFLIRNGSGVNGRDRYGATPLIMAAYQNWPEMVKFLLENGAEVDSTVTIDTYKVTSLYISVNRYGDQGEKVIKLLIEHGANVNYATIIDEGIIHFVNRTVLMEAIAHKGLKIVKILVENGADINKFGRDGTPLDYAIQYDNKGAYNYLIQQGAYIIHPLIGLDTDYGNGRGIGDPTAPYQIPMSKEFVQKTQYRPLPLNDEVLRVHLQTEPKPHVVFACPVGHLHSREDCGVPTELKVCGHDECPFLVGGVHHFLAPGNYIVYHDSYDNATVWHGNFPVFDYPTYKLLVRQYNIAAHRLDIPEIVPVAERGFTNIARLSDIPVAEGTECPMCGDELQVGKTYVLPDCGHPICEECLARIRGGNLENINVGDAENFQRRRCGVCSRRFRFGGGMKRRLKHKL
jgi:hypothetical protein